MFDKKCITYNLGNLPRQVVLNFHIKCTLNRGQNHRKAPFLYKYLQYGQSPASG